MTNAASNTRKRIVPAKYPQLRVIVTVSPPVSPSVVAAILMIQKLRVTAGTLLKVMFSSSRVAIPSVEDLTTASRI